MKKRNPYLTVHITGDDSDGIIERLKMMDRRQAEMKLLRDLVHVKKPKRSSSFQLKDEPAFFAAVDHALGSKDPAFISMADDAARTGNARFFETAALAIRAVVDGRKYTHGIVNAHVIAVLQAKLQLEQKHSKLPTQKAVRILAEGIFQKWFAPLGLELYTLEDKEDARFKDKWDAVFERAGLKYLDGAVRGPARRK